MSSSRMTEKIHILHSEIGAKDAIHHDLDEYVEKIEPTGTDLLVAVYVRPTIKRVQGVGGKVIEIDLSAGGSQLDDKYQGKVCLVLKRGPGVEDCAHWFKDGKTPQPDDWVLVTVQKRTQFLMGAEDKTRHVALVPADGVSAVLTDPDCFL